MRTVGQSDKECDLPTAHIKKARVEMSETIGWLRLHIGLRLSEVVRVVWWTAQLAYRSRETTRHNPAVAFS
jgi:hypothetical protein